MPKAARTIVGRRAASTTAHAPPPRSHPIEREFPRAALPITNPEQLADYKAACEGKITWAQYYRKWKSSPLLG